MKTLTAGALAKVTQELGTEPLILVAIDWYGTGDFFLYTDRLVSGLDTDIKVLSVSDISVTPSSKTGQASDVNVSLDDTDGNIKATLNTVNIYNKKCIIYQFFKGLVDADKFILFKGMIDAPVSWSESDRTVDLQIISEVEDTEIGVSLEETDIIDVNPDDNSPPWPLAFGNVVHVPATRIVQYPIAKLSEPFCVIDQMLYSQLSALEKAWYDQQMILSFWKLVSQGASNIGAIPSILMQRYIAIIKLEYQYEQLVKSNKGEIAEANKFRRKRRDKSELEKRKIEEIGDLRDEIKGWKVNLKLVQAQKELIERQIDLAAYEIQLKRAASSNVVGAVNGLMSIYQTYVAAMMEICRQSECATLTVKVEDSEQFTQNTPLELLINNLKWRGVFVDGTLTLHPYPLPRYSAIPLGSRGSVADDCGNIDDMKGADLFWIDDASYNLTNMYLFVESRYDGRKHIIKVIEQDGTKCRFQLMPFGTYNYQGQYGANVVKSVTSLPAVNFSGWDDLPAGWNDLAPQIAPWVELSAATLQALYPALPNDDETKNLRQLEKLLPMENGWDVVVVAPRPRDIFTVIGEDIIEITEVSPVPLPNWFTSEIFLEEYPNEIKWRADVGDEVREAAYDYDIYVANILPSTIKAVYAYKTENDKKSLTPVPSTYYAKNEAEPLYDADGNLKLTVASIRMKVPLSQIQGEDWEDQIYVTLDSYVGPNTVDIISYFIDNYTDKSKDATTFASVRAAIDNYPSSFALFDRPNVFEIINEIAMQARCVAYVNNDTYYLKYLAAEPASDLTLTEADISGERSLQVSYGDASDLTTKLLVDWKPNYLPDTQKYLTLRHNVALYGLREKEINMFIYNIESLVKKSATFWLIRWANLWKRVSFTTFLPQIRLELYDTVLFDLAATHLATADIKGVIENISYSTNGKELTFDCWLPVKMGEMSQYVFAWPAAADADASFPTDIEIIQGNAGGNGIGKGIVTIIQGQ